MGHPTPTVTGRVFMRRFRLLLGQCGRQLPVISSKVNNVQLRGEARMSKASHTDPILQFFMVVAPGAHITLSQQIV